MLILVGKSPTTVNRDHRHPNVGILISPRRRLDGQIAHRVNLPWAADNDCFNGGLDEQAFVNMLNFSTGVPGCLFVAAPDVVADAGATLDQFDFWSNEIRKGYNMPVALVAQDGMTLEDIEWWAGAYDALFIGGSTEWKMSDEAYQLVKRVKKDGVWVHMGRVNTQRRLKLAKSWGCDSVDGTATVLFTNEVLPWQLAIAAGGTQTQMLGDD